MADVKGVTYGVVFRLNVTFGAVFQK